MSINKFINNNNGMVISFNLNNWVASLSGESTHVFVISGKFEISLITPNSAPAVLDDPVVSIGLRSISYSKNTVIQLDAGALSLLVDSTFVVLKLMI